MVLTIVSQLFSMTDVITCSLLLLVAYLSWKYFQGYNLPPGPWGLPILGYLPFMGKSPPEERFTQLSKKYGDIMSFFFGSELLIVLNSYDSIKEALEKQADIFAGRPQSLFFKIRETDKGVSRLDGEPWKEHRRFILSSLAKCGEDKTDLESKVSEEIHCFLEKMAEQKEQPFDVSNLLSVSAANITCILQFGKRFDYDDERLIVLLILRNDILRVFPRIPSRSFYPWLKHFPFSESFTHQEEVNKAQDNLENFVMDLVQEHMAEYEENSRKNLIDAYFTERNSVVLETGDEGCFGVRELQGTLIALLGAGTETITSTLRWAFLCMILCPNIQKKVQKEIENAVGTERTPRMSDKDRMPYTQAVLMEVQRFGSVTPLSLPHSNLEATELFGYRIPKRSNIIPNIWAVHHDNKFWENPHEFNPDRFISKEGQVVNKQHFIPFGIGTRACLGESLANMELFLYFTSFLQRFDLQPSPGTTPKLEIETTYARRPKPFNFCTVQRKDFKK